MRNPSAFDRALGVVARSQGIRKITQEPGERR
ncbi:MAG: hypothetical protein QOH65_1087 [Methylobacteriaceae bacterium]|nr:hypothetical protein [Methylobacteriaceae bacterium]